MNETRLFQLYDEALHDSGMSTITSQKNKNNKTDLERKFNPLGLGKGEVQKKKKASTT